MSEDRLSVVIAGLGEACLSGCMKSIVPWPSELILALDMVGRSQIGLGFPYDSLPVEAPYLVVRNENRHNWNLTNQTLNIGVAAAKGRWVLCTHEDTNWYGGWGAVAHETNVLMPHERFPAERGPYPFITEYERVIDVLEAQGNKIDGHEVVSVYFPFEQRGGGAHEPGKDVPTLGACYSAVSSIIRKDWWEEIGRFDEEHGIFYDYQVTAEMVKRGVFGYVHPLPGPLPYHERSVNYSAMQTAPGRANPGGFLERIEKWDLHRTFADVYGGGLGWHEWMRANEKRFECQKL